jgi:hypothetical protein
LIEQTQFSHHPLFGKIALGFGAAEARAINVSDGDRLFAFGALPALVQVNHIPHDRFRCLKCRERAAANIENSFRQKRL